MKRLIAIGMATVIALGLTGGISTVKASETLKGNEEVLYLLEKTTDGDYGIVVYGESVESIEEVDLWGFNTVSTRDYVKLQSGVEIDTRGVKVTKITENSDFSEFKGVKVFNEGTYLVGKEIQPGIYYIVSEESSEESRVGQVVALNGVNKDKNSNLERFSMKGAKTFEVKETDFAITIARGSKLCK